MVKLTYKGKVPYSLNTGLSFRRINKGDTIEVTDAYAKVLLANHPKDWVKAGKTPKAPKPKPASETPKSKRKKGGKNA